LHGRTQWNIQVRTFNKKVAFLVNQSYLAPMLLRFLFGGTAVVLATLVARAFGGRIGGIFAAFPAVYLAAIISLRLEYKGQELVLLSQQISQGALIGMIADIICAYTASRFIMQQGWKYGLLCSLLIWCIAATGIYLAWQVLI
jgi:uncharacterized membrane protein (GlpM family)